MTKEALIKTIYEFYRNHENDCDRAYRQAMSSDISEIYIDGGELLQSPHLNKLAKVAIVILTANKFEKNILHQEIFKKTNKQIYSFTIKLFENPNKHNITDAYLFEWNGYMIFHIGCRVTGSYTIGGCADAIRYCVNSPYLFPTAFVSFGICFGCREEEDHLCDTVISRKIYPYFIGAKIDDKALKTNDDHVLFTTPELVNSIERLQDHNAFSRRKLGFNVSMNNYISGEAVVSSKEFRDYFTGITTQEIFAGDMEAYALYKECCNAYKSIPCVVVKSICDWGIVKNINSPKLFSAVTKREGSADELKSIKDKLQALAALHSFIVLDILLQNKVFEQSIYARIRDEFLAKQYEHVLTLERIREEASKLNKETSSSLSDKYFEQLCKCLEQEGIAKVDYNATFVTKRNEKGAE